MVAAANLTYLIGIALPSVAVWLLRRNEPDRVRAVPGPRRHRSGSAWSPPGCGCSSTVLGFEQFGLPTVIFGLGLAYSGSLLYAWRVARRPPPVGAARCSVARSTSS